METFPENASLSQYEKMELENQRTEWRLQSVSLVPTYPRISWSVCLKKKNSVLCCSQGVTEIPESWISVLQTACPTQKGYRTCSSDHVSQCLVGEECSYKAMPSFQSLTFGLGWHHWKSNNLDGRLAGRSSHHFQSPLFLKFHYG